MDNRWSAERGGTVSREEKRVKSKEVPGVRLAPEAYGLVTRSLTESVVTLNLRATTIPFWRGLCRARSVITDQSVSLQRSRAGDPVRV
jgi:hypothetical protein